MHIHVHVMYYIHSSIPHVQCVYIHVVDTYSPRGMYMVFMICGCGVGAIQYYAESLYDLTQKASMYTCIMCMFKWEYTSTCQSHEVVYMRSDQLSLYKSPHKL